MSKPKYINAERVIDTLRNMARIHKEMAKGDPFEITYAGALAGIADALDVMPAADVTEVVRCKDCKYRYVLNRGESSICNLLDAQNNGEAYCSYGERKDG